MSVRALVFILAVNVVAASAPMFGHHSAVAYAPKSVVLKNAMMTKVLWASPHVILSFTVKEANGALSKWSAETGSPGSVARVGWTRTSLKVGDAVTIELFPAKNGAHVGRLKKVTFPDGHELLDTQSNPDSVK